MHTVVDAGAGEMEWDQNVSRAFEGGIVDGSNEIEAGDFGSSVAFFVWQTEVGKTTMRGVLR